MFDLFKSSQDHLNNTIVGSITKLTNNVTELTLIVTDMVSTVKVLSTQINELQKCVIHLHERLKQLETPDVSGNEFPSFKL
jgi:hypothetical protein